MRIFGKNPVLERLRSQPATIRKISIEPGFPEAAYIHKKAKQHNIPVIVLPRTKMQKIMRHANAQGVFIDIGEFEYMDYQDMLEQARSKKRTLIFLDGLTDPQNLGAILRSLGSLGHFSVCLPRKESVGVTEAVLRVASGGDNYVPVARVNNLNKAIRQAKKEGFTIAGSVVEGGVPVDETPFPFPLGLVIGSEQKGVRPVIRKECDLKVSVPMHVATMSLNAAQAATIFAYEINKQKKEYKNRARSGA